MHNISEEIKLKFLANVPVPIGKLNFHVPILKEIVEIGDRKYSKILSSLLIQKDYIENIEDYNLSSNLDIAYVLCHHNKDFKESFLKGLRLFFKEDAFMSPENYGLFFYLGEIHETKIIRGDNFDHIQRMIIASNNISLKKDEYKPGNDTAKEFISHLEETKRQILELKKKKDSFLGNVSALAWKSPNINIFNVFDLNVFQYHNALKEVDKIDQYLFTMHGIYSGTVDGKKVNLSKIHWSNN